MNNQVHLSCFQVHVGFHSRHDPQPENGHFLELYTKGL